MGGIGRCRGNEGNGGDIDRGGSIGVWSNLRGCH